MHAIGSWDRPEEPARLRPPLLHVLPSGDADEPLVFVEIALTTGIATRCSRRCSTRRRRELDPEHADTAVFYSISNCQPGLAGVNLGTALIKQVVEELRRDLPQLQRFVTLSPIPGLPRAGSKTRCARASCRDARARAAPRRARSRARPARRHRLGHRRGDPTRARRAVRALPHDGDRRPRARSGRELPPRQRRHDRADQLARRPEPDRTRPIRRA